MVHVTADTFAPAYAADRSLALVRGWLYLVCALVIAIVLVGGATRLTDSGLSITEWAPIRGVVPPLSRADWLLEFDKYRTTTEYQTVNRGMSMGDFQVIYWWEWGHRFLARSVGLVFALPLAFFWLTGRLTPWLKPRLLVLLAMGGAQGFIGWWMVKSGLVDRVDVSQYRLAAHLTMASLIFAYALWLARSLVPATSQAPSAASIWGMALAGGVLLQIALGAFVAGMDAGLAYNTWPLMDGAIVPSGLAPSPSWTVNLFENAKTVQFNHRMLAYALLALALAHAVWAWSHRPVRRWGAGVAALVTTQALMGIVTLVLVVPMSWALAHQIGAIIVLGVVVAYWREVSLPALGGRPLRF